MLALREKLTPWVIGVFRIVIGLLFFTHGTAWMFEWPGPARIHPSPAVGQWPWWWAGLIEAVVGVFLMLGLGTRVVAFLGSGTMAVAYFWQHQSKGLFPVENGGQGSALFCWVLLLIVFIGPGRLALDALVARRVNASVSSPALVDAG